MNNRNDQEEIETVAQKGLPVRWRYKGYFLIPRFPKEAIDTFRQYYPEKSDVLVCAYSKGGSIWTQDIAYQLLHGKPLANVDDFDTVEPWLEMHGTKIYDYKTPRMIRAHSMPDGQLNFTDEGKYFYVVRNPLDSAVSMFKHLKSVEHFQFEDGKFDDFFQLWLTEDIWCNSYFSHIQNWLPYLSKPNVLMLRYEDQRKDLIAGITKMANFLKKYENDLGVPIDASEEYIKQVAFNSSINEMKKRNPHSTNWKPGMTHVKEGTVGGWKDYFTEEQLCQLEKKYKDMFSGTPAITWWKDMNFPRD